MPLSFLGAKLRQNCCPTRYHIVTYDEMVNNIQKVTIEMFNFINKTATPKMLKEAKRIARDQITTNGNFNSTENKEIILNKWRNYIDNGTEHLFLNDRNCKKVFTVLKTKT